MASFDLIVIGSGPAGQRASIHAAKSGKQVALVERKDVIGGTCINTGTIPSKTMREAVLHLSGFLFQGIYGVNYHVKEGITMADLSFRVQQVIKNEIDVTQAQLSRNNITLLNGSASFVDPHTIKVEGSRGDSLHQGASIIIATGTVPAESPAVPVNGRTILLSDQVMQMPQLPKTMIVVGGGVIGVEYASMFAALGVAVTLIERRDRPLEFLDREIVDELLHQMRSRNVTFRLGEAVASIAVESSPAPRAVLLLESGKRLVTDVVLFSAGRVSATDRLNLGAAGLLADERGRLKVDETFCTTVPHIFAAGDVIGYPSLAATSSEQGRLAACHAFGVEAGPMSPHFPIGIYAVPEISMVGPTEQDLTRDRVPYETGMARYREIARGQILGDDSGLLKMLFHREDRRLLGVHAIGTGATELIHIGQAVLAHGGGMAFFLQNVFNYPTLAECYKVAALDASNKLRR